MQEYLDGNRRRWNEVTPIHERSEFYDVDAFRAGKITLKAIELEELGDLAGKSLLHLQCHFGMDTMSWARLGAKVTGADFSEKAIDLAKSLNEQVGLDAPFICSDIYRLPEVLDRKFDIVFTSYGVLCWLPDMTKWAQVIANFLKPGGTFYIVEFHPFTHAFETYRDAQELRVAYPYFHAQEPTRWDNDGTYADANATVTNPSYEWSHTLSDILNALIAAGLRIEFLHEFPYCSYQAYSPMERGEDGWWRLNNQDGMIPLMFSVKAKLDRA